MKQTTLNSFLIAMYEEVSEALDAYYKKDYKQTLKELAQCEAVILRMMEFVKKQSDKEAAASSHPLGCG